MKKLTCHQRAAWGNKFRWGSIIVYLRKILTALEMCKCDADEEWERYQRARKDLDCKELGASEE